MTSQEASPVVYPHGYSGSRQGSVVYQAQQVPHPASHQAPFPYVMPVHYAGGPQQHYYVVNHPQSERTAMPPGQVCNVTFCFLLSYLVNFLIYVLI